jgi:hypothetical protein
MASNRTTQQSGTAHYLSFTLDIILRASLFFIALNLVFAVTNPLPLLGQISAYNTVFPGRVRLPYSENPEEAHSLSLFQLDAMFSSHEIHAGEKLEEEYRVLFIGDSSVWGFLLPPDQTLTAFINSAELQTHEGKQLRAYNLGYPTISLTKDVLLMDYAMRYNPDLLVWFVTLESFPFEKQVFTPLVQHNPEPVRGLINTYDLNLDTDDEDFVDLTLWERTIVGQKRALADLLRLQMYGLLWAATGIDQHIPETYTPRQEDLEAEETYYGLVPPSLVEEDLAFDVLAAGIDRTGTTPVLLVNEPIFISQGENSELRYNFFYPRWVFDAYRQLLAVKSAQNDWNYLDLWNSIPSPEFTNTAIHITPEGTLQLAQEVGEAIMKLVEGNFESTPPDQR